MALKKTAASGKKGMNRDTHMSSLGKEEYSFALNANIQDEHGNGQITIQNEPSNVRCSNFKEGYRVVGHKYDINSETTYFFLTNPSTGFSEIGFIDTFQEAEDFTPDETGTGQTLAVVLETPLENTVQEWQCNYNTLLTDECEGETGCLGFSVDYPIHENNVIIKYGKGGKTLWFTDNNKPFRYVQLDNIQQYYESIPDCGGEPEPVCLQCEKLLVYTPFTKPCLEPEVIQNGGALRAGTVQVLVAGSDNKGNELTHYMSITNVIPIHDKNNNILDQTNLDYKTNQAIRVSVNWADEDYEYFKITVLYTSGLNGVMTPYNYGIFTRGTESVIIDTLQGKQTLDLANQVLTRRVSYVKARGITTAGGHLFQYGLEEETTPNLQPVVNLLGSHMRWASYIAKEGLYEDGISVAKYKSHLRGEVYPAAIKFIKDGGQELPLFPFIARPPFASEIEEPENLPITIASIEASNQDCQTGERTKRWQFENTAIVTEDCFDIASNGIDITTTERSSCIVMEEGAPKILETISGILVQNGVSDIIGWINNNTAMILGSSSPSYAQIKDALLVAIAAEDSCEIIVSAARKVDTQVEEEVGFAISVVDQEQIQIPQDLLDYIPSLPVVNNTGYETDMFGVLVPDTVFQTTFLEAGESVYKRLPTGNNTCALSTLASIFVVPQLSNNNHLRYRGEITTVTTLLSTKTATQTRFRAEITLSGTSGSVSLTAGGYSGTINYATSLSFTASTFAATQAAAVFSATGLVLTAVGPKLFLTGGYTTFTNITITHISGSLAGTSVCNTFTNRLHTNAIWFKVDIDTANKIFEMGTPNCQFPDDVSTESVRLSVYETCGSISDLSIYSRIVDNIHTVGGIDKLIELDAIDFPSGFAYIAIDTPIRAEFFEGTVKNILQATCGDFPVYQREVVTTEGVMFTDLRFGKKQIREATYSKVIPNIKGCTAKPFKKGLFSYVESTMTYPCNKELFDSTSLIIRPEDLPTAYQEEFENYYTSGLDGSGNYVLTNEADFRDKPIRHYKFPDNNISPFMSTDEQIQSDFDQANIYPIGFSIDNEAINAYLDIAVRNGLLSAEERFKIKSYEIYRGNRSTHKSIIAKGVLSDMYKYTETNGGVSEDIYYPNYPLNTLGFDLHNQVPHPFNSTRNNFFSFLSPDTSFYKPSLTREMEVEGYLFGKSTNLFDEINQHPTYVLLKQAGYNLATTLAISEVAFELALNSGELSVAGAAGGVSVVASTGVAIVQIGLIAAAATYRAGKYRYEWMQTLKNLGTPHNFAYVQSSVGYYNNFRSNPSPDQKLRGLAVSTYLKDGRWEIANEQNGSKYSINNLDREHSVLLHTGAQSLEYTTEFTNYDNLNANSGVLGTSRPLWNGIGRSPSIIGNTAMMYATLKDFLPAQYGLIESVDWLPTGYCGDLTAENYCEAIFGGDTFITRFSVKKKLPFFTTNAMGQAPLTPFAYSDYFNINPESTTTGRTFLDYEILEDTNNYATLLFPTNKSNYFFQGPEDTTSKYYMKPTEKFYVFAYGIPHFLVESSVNNDFRYAGREPHENFYPNVGDHLNWNQEVNVSIRQPNIFLYNDVYSATGQRMPYTYLPSNYSKEVFDKLRNLSNTVVYSRQDATENSVYEPWLQYRAADSYTFSKQLGNLQSMTFIESQQILARFDNGYLVLNSIDRASGKENSETYSIGSGGIFQGRPIEFNSSVLGYAGTQNQTILNTEFGTFWADAKRGKVFQLMPNGQGLKEISSNQEAFSSGIEKWFKRHLPFKILKSFPEVNTDNNQNGIGLAMGWDDRTKRLFITKKDYTPKAGVKYDSRVGFYIGEIEVSCPEGYVKDDVGDCIEEETGFKGQPIYTAETVVVTDKQYFEEASWTVAYNPILASWISYYSFLPNYYIGYNDYFKTGINLQGEPTLWTHLPFLSSYQVFYGTLYPFIIELPLVSSFTNSVLRTIEYYLDVRKYYNRYNYANNYGVGFNKAYVYNEFQNTGLLELTHQKEENLALATSYPRHKANSVEVLQTEINGMWSFNHLYNIIRNEKSGLPVWVNDAVEVMQSTDDRLLNYNPVLMDYLRGEYFLLRLLNDTESRFKFLFRLSTDERNYYEK
jgi:hypothetical protein